VPIILPEISAFDPELVASVSPHPEHLISDVVCENITVLALHFSHWTEIKLLRGFGTNIFSLFILSSQSNFQLAYSTSFLHGLSLTGLACIAQSNFFCGLGSPFKLGEFLAAIPLFVFGVPASAFCHRSVLTLFVYCNRLHCMRLALGAELAHLLVHLHRYFMNSR